ncbi:MAG: alkaline phosphatase D family protein [Verrucomicrobiota bacterium]|nr:alkaline phosphatase D family protein [Verrucomicrobiota bacterium]
MVGWVTQREAALWVQTGEDAVVNAHYWLAGTSRTDASETSAVITSENHHYTATLILSGLLPGKEYAGQLLINGKAGESPYFHFETPPRTLPEDKPTTIRLGLASGFRDLDTVSDGILCPTTNHTALKALVTMKPVAMLWLGNTAQMRDADWSSAAGYWRRATASRSTGELAPLLNSCANYAVLGALDYGPPGVGEKWIHRATALETHHTFWPSPSGNEHTWTQVNLGEIDLFLLDMQSHRNYPLTQQTKREFLGQEQLDWLADALRTSKAPVKVLASSIPLLNPVDAPEHFASAKAERDRLLELLETLNVEGVVILSGSTEFSEATRLPRARSYPLYELSVGRLTDASESTSTALNYFRVPGTTVKEPHFAIMTLSGPRESRALRFEVFDCKGESLWADTIPLKDLK